MLPYLYPIGEGQEWFPGACVVCGIVDAPVVRQTDGAVLVACSPRGTASELAPAGIVPAAEDVKNGVL